ncbi:MAG: tyrosine-type recombinase/integrase, partial [Pseudomonadota bacterium]
PRPGEALALRWQDYDGRRVQIHATHSQGKRKGATKTGERRRVYVPEWVRGRMEELPTRADVGAMFVGHHGEPLLKKVNINAIWRDALAECGYEQQDPYVCRHSRAAELLSMGKASIAECAYQMGHSEAVFVGIYAEMIEEFRPEGDYSQFEREIAPASPQFKPGRPLRLVKQ